MRVSSLTTTSCFALLVIPNFASPRHISAQQSEVQNALKQVEIPMTGWATRLTILPQEQWIRDTKQHQKTMSFSGGDLVTLPYYFGGYIFQIALQWCFDLVNLIFEPEFVHHIEPQPSWNDTIPRFVAYGDSYVANNSLGVPDPKMLAGFHYYNIAFWTSENGAEDNVQEWTKGSNAQRNAIVKSYNAAGIRLGIAVFGATSKPQSSGEDPIGLANRIAAFVIKYGLQGVDVDYEEYNLFEQVKATAWLIPFTRQLRSRLHRVDGYYLSHAPIAPLFSTDNYPRSYTWLDQRIGSAIDFYNVQYYNQEGAYSSCQTLVFTADGGAPKTSIMELTSVWGISMNKIVAGKPVRSNDADNGDGYMTPSKFAACLAKANAAGWNAGAMWWEYRGDVQFVIQPVLRSLGVK